MVGPEFSERGGPSKRGVIASARVTMSRPKTAGVRYECRVHARFGHGCCGSEQCVASSVWRARERPTGDGAQAPAPGRVHAHHLLASHTLRARSAPVHPQARPPRADVPRAHRVACTAAALAVHAWGPDVTITPELALGCFIAVAFARDLSTHGLPGPERCAVREARGAGAGGARRRRIADKWCVCVWCTAQQQQRSSSHRLAISHQCARPHTSTASSSRP